MSYYNTCPHCGANLDPGERCDCTQAKIDHLFEKIPSLPLSDLEILLDHAEQELEKRKAARECANTTDSKVEQIERTDSTTILPDESEVVNHEQ